MGLRTGLLPGLAAGFALLLATGCGGGTAVPAPAPAAPAAAPVTLTPAPGRQTLSETGSTLLLPLVGTWATAYHQQHPGVTITVAGTGSATGITDAFDGKASIGASDAYLSSGDLVQNPGLVNVPLVISAQQVNYFLPGLPPSVHIHLDGPVLAAMYSGQITSWNDPAIAALNPGVRLPATKVVPFHRSDGSGDTFLHQLRVHPRRGLEQRDRLRHLGSLARRPPCRGREGQRQHGQRLLRRARLRRLRGHQLPGQGAERRPGRG